MGCDIHSYVEVKHHSGEWVAPHCFKADYLRSGSAELAAIYHEPEFQTEASSPIRDRNYALFAFLADVRNYADAITPAIVWLTKGSPYYYTRTLPSDLSQVVRREWVDCRGDAHSESWFTLAELEIALAAAQFNGEADGFSDVLRWSLDQMHERCGGAKRGDVRLIFWFDN